MIVAQFWEYTKTHQIVNFMVCDLYINRAVKKWELFKLAVRVTLRKDNNKTLEYNYEQIICIF